MGHGIAYCALLMSSFLYYLYATYTPPWTCLIKEVYLTQHAQRQSYLTKFCKLQTFVFCFKQLVITYLFYHLNSPLMHTWCIKERPWIFEEYVA